MIFLFVCLFVLLAHENATQDNAKSLSKVKICNSYCFSPALRLLNHHSGCYSAPCFSSQCLEQVYLFPGCVVFFSFGKLKVKLLSFYSSPFSLPRFFEAQTLYLCYSYHWWLTRPQMSFLKLTANTSQTVSGSFSHMLDRCSSGSATLAMHYSKCYPICSFRLSGFLTLIYPSLADVTCTSNLLTFSSDE